MWIEPINLVSPVQFSTSWAISWQQITLMDRISGFSYRVITKIKLARHLCWIHLRVIRTQEWLCININWLGNLWLKLKVCVVNSCAQTHTVHSVRALVTYYWKSYETCISPTFFHLYVIYLNSSNLCYSITVVWNFKPHGNMYAHTLTQRRVCIPGNIAPLTQHGFTSNHTHNKMGKGTVSNPLSLFLF